MTNLFISDTSCLSFGTERNPCLIAHCTVRFGGCCNTCSLVLCRITWQWHDGALVSAMRSGDLVLIDEISLADDAVLERLNSVLEPERTLTLAEKGGTEVSRPMPLLRAPACALTRRLLSTFVSVISAASPTSSWRMTSSAFSPL